MSDFFSVSSVVLAILSLILSGWSVLRARRVVALPLAKLRSIESRTESLENSVSEWSQTVTDLANSLKMTRVRAAAKHASSDRKVDALPDPYKDPDAWRAAKNRTLMPGKFNQPEA